MHGLEAEGCTSCRSRRDVEGAASNPSCTARLDTCCTSRAGRRSFGAERRTWHAYAGRSWSDSYDGNAWEIRQS